MNLFKIKHGNKNRFWDGRYWHPEGKIYKSIHAVKLAIKHEQQGNFMKPLIKYSGIKIIVYSLKEIDNIDIKDV